MNQISSSAINISKMCSLREREREREIWHHVSLFVEIVAIRIKVMVIVLSPKDEANFVNDARQQ